MRLKVLLIIVILINAMANIIRIDKVILCKEVAFGFNYNYNPIIDNIIAFSSFVLLIISLYSLRLISSKEVLQFNLDSLRRKQHDYKNHLVVISGLIQIGKIDKALRYIHNLDNNHTNIHKMKSKGNEIEDTILSLLKTKREQAEKKGIEVRYNVNLDWSKVKVKEKDLTIVLFNLIDNAVFELNKFDNNRILQIDLYTYKDQFIIRVHNNKPVLSDEIKENMFNKGYTTKGNKGSGLGLYNTKGIVKKYKGRIEVDSRKNIGTIFTIYF